MRAARGGGTLKRLGYAAASAAALA
ncbi:MAG: hypothetical protein QOF57_1803, partial [Frankiaceae bacterium]|nr:hypothetical protein [Frankiaceae bacterium]